MFQIIDYAPVVLILFRITLPRATHGAIDSRTLGALYKQIYIKDNGTPKIAKQKTIYYY